MSVQYLTEQLNVSSGYLSNMLRNLTGANDQQYIHQKVIERANKYLTAGNLSVSEVAYQLGFEHP
ncbi:MAG: helix-turn-helix domain-containing protein [Mucilaginibacter sp.]|uniref:helix-turn-helix domain-containing protein n=1 Tax=Mucilaginibacter sp. TaxID=1882438 RepID=UPI0031B3138E